MTPNQASTTALHHLQPEQLIVEMYSNQLTGHNSGATIQQNINPALGGTIQKYCPHRLVALDTPYGKSVKTAFEKSWSAGWVRETRTTGIVAGLCPTSEILTGDRAPCAHRSRVLGVASKGTS
jgi:hypothetical protein